MKNNLVYKSNKLINACYSLSVNEQRVLLSCISQINSRQDLDITQPLTLSIEQAQGLFYTDTDAKNAYRDIKNACKSLVKKTVVFRSECGRFEGEHNWVGGVDFDNEKMKVYLWIHGGIKPYLSVLRGSFTKYRLQYIAELTSAHAIRFYELMVHWYTQDTRHEWEREIFKEMEIEAFKEMLGIANKYNGNFSALNDKVINPIIEQINSKTDFQLAFQLKKQRNRYKFIQMTFRRDPDIIEQEMMKRLAREEFKLAQEA